MQLQQEQEMATIDVSDCCLVCADPLEWTGVGVCGHKEICSRCVARMRFVLKDNNCVLCKQESPAVFFTRFMGDYTARVPAEDYPAKLKVRCHGYLPASAWALPAVHISASGSHPWQPTCNIGRLINACGWRALAGASQQG